MPKILVVGTESFDFPEEGENSGYGESVTDWAVAVTDALTTVQQPNDIVRTSASILNNISSPTAVAGFLFDSSEVVSINAEFVITRTTDSPAQTLVQSGFIEGNYNGTTWVATIRSIRDAGVLLDITNSGQITYTSSNVSGTNYSGTILFKAKVFNETV
jgi:hypothetical protein